MSRFYAEYLLQSGSSFNLEEFVSMWKEAVPDGITVDVDKHLLGRKTPVDHSTTWLPCALKRNFSMWLPRVLKRNLATCFPLACFKEEIDPCSTIFSSPSRNQFDRRNEETENRAIFHREFSAGKSPRTPRSPFQDERKVDDR